MHGDAEGGFFAQRIAMMSVVVSLFIAMLLLAPSLDDLAPGPEAAPKEIAHGPSMDDADSLSDDLDL
jgi:hypothetical protein